MIAGSAARQVLEDAIDRRVFAAAAAEIGDHSGRAWEVALGRLTFDEDAPATTPGTVFDLASLTKPIATTTVIMQLLAHDRVQLSTRVTEIFDEWRGVDRALVTIRDLLAHASGLPARLVDAPPVGRREFEHEICAIPLEYAPRTRSIYSDLGFILLGFGAEVVGGARLDRQFDTLCRELGIDESLTFGPVGLPAIAPTMPLAEDRRKRRLIGEVQDDYAFALHGVAGHAGLFGTAAAVGAFARLVLRAARGDNSVPAPLTPAAVARFTCKSDVAGSSRALGWDTMLPTSSCGTQMSPAAFGHVGYTGTSLWIDPARDRYFVLLTNRACGGGTLDQIRGVRRAFHDAFP